MLFAGASVDFGGGYVGTSATTTVPVRATAYTEPAAESQMELLSNNANDDGSPGGTGTRTVRVTYYDGNLAGPFTEDVTLNGTAAVATVATNIRFVDSIRSLTVGSNGTNVGTITLRIVGGGAVVGTIAAGDGFTFWAHRYVANGKCCFLQRIMVGTQGASGNLMMRITRPLVANAFEEQLGVAIRVITAQPSQIYDFNMLVEGPAMLLLRYRPDANTANTTYANFSYFEQ